MVCQCCYNVGVGCPLVVSITCQLDGYSTRRCLVVDDVEERVFGKRFAAQVVCQLNILEVGVGERVAVAEHLLIFVTLLVSN